MSAAADIQKAAERKEAAAAVELAAAKALEVAANAEGNPTEKATLLEKAQALVAAAEKDMEDAQAELADAQAKIASGTVTVAAAKAASAEAEAKQSSAKNNLAQKQAANVEAEIVVEEPVADKAKTVEEPKEEAAADAVVDEAKSLVNYPPEFEAPLTKQEFTIGSSYAAYAFPAVTDVDAADTVSVTITEDANLKSFMEFVFDDEDKTKVSLKAGKVPDTWSEQEMGSFKLEITLADSEGNEKKEYLEYEIIQKPADAIDEVAEKKKEEEKEKAKEEAVEDLVASLTEEGASLEEI